MSRNDILTLIVKIIFNLFLDLQIAAQVYCNRKVSKFDLYHD